MTASTIHTTLFIRALQLRLNLGWSDKEQKKKQTVLLDMDIYFSKPPLACESDNLSDAICYAKIIDDIQTTIPSTPYRLIEHLSARIYALVKTHLPQQTHLIVRLTKSPRIKHLTGGVCFEYGDKKSS